MRYAVTLIVDDPEIKFMPPGELGDFLKNLRETYRTQIPKAIAVGITIIPAKEKPTQTVYAPQVIREVPIDPNLPPIKININPPGGQP